MDSFTDQDRHDLNVLTNEILLDANGVSMRAWLVGSRLLTVQGRELFRIPGCKKIGEWTKPRFGFDEQQAKDYISVCLNLSEDFVKDKRIYLDGLLQIVYAKDQVRTALLELCPQEATADLLKKAREAGTRALRAGKEVAEAVAEALAGGKPEVPKVPVVRTLEGRCENLLRRIRQDVAEMEKAQKQAGAGQTIRAGLYVRLCQHIELLQQSAEELRATLEQNTTAAPPSPAPPAEHPRPQPPPQRAEPSRPPQNRRNLDRDPGSGETAGPGPIEDPDRNLLGGANPPESHNIVPPQGTVPKAAAPSKPPAEDAPEDGPDLTDEELHDEVAGAVEECLPPEEKQELEGHLFRLLQGQPIGAAEACLRGLYESCQRVEPGLDRELFDLWLARMLDPDFDRRWDFIMVFYLKTELPGFRLHLRILWTYDLPARQKQLAADWDWKMDWNTDTVTVLKKEIEAKYGHLYE